MSNVHPFPFTNDRTREDVRVSSMEIAMILKGVSFCLSAYWLLIFSNSLMHGTHQVAQRLTIIAVSLLLLSDLKLTCRPLKLLIFVSGSSFWARVKKEQVRSIE